MPDCEAPVESCRYFPSKPLLFPRPLGCTCDFEFSMMRVDSQVLAARIMVAPVTWYSCISSLFTYDTPVAFPFRSVMTSRTMALDMSSRLPVFRAGITRQEEAEKSAYTLQLRLHCPQKKHTPRSLLPGNASVRTDPLPGITLTPAFAAP